MKLFDRPIICNYYVTLRCNSRCEYCNIWKNSEYKSLKEQTIGEVKANLIHLKKLGVKLIDFTGGEPLLFKNIIPTLKYAKKLGFYTSITTNGVLYGNFAEKLKGLVDQLQFSLDSMDENINNKRRGIESYQKTIESIRLAKKLNQKPYISVTVDEGNIDEIDKILDFCKKEKVGLFVNPVFSYFGNASLTNKEVIKRLESLAFKPYVYLNLSRLKFIKEGGNRIDKPLCKALTTTIVISPDNYFVIPCFHHQFKKIKIKNNLAEIYQSEEIEKLRENVGKWDFSNNCMISCYFGTSLLSRIFSKYFVLDCMSILKYFIDRATL